MERKSAVDQVKKLAEKSDYAVVMSYSLNPTILRRSVIPRVRDFRVLYSCRTKSKNPLPNLESYSNKLKQVEGEFDRVQYDSSHAKVYLFARSEERHISLSLLMGSFNLTPKNSVELYGTFHGHLDSARLESEDFMNLFNENPNISKVKESFSGDSPVLSALAVLLTHWHNSDCNVKRGEPPYFVSTQDNSLRKGFSEMVKEAAKHHQITSPEDSRLEFLFVTPFHSEEAIENVIGEIRRSLEDIGLDLPFSIRLLTNGNAFAKSCEEEAFVSPRKLKRFVDDDHPLEEVRFWGSAQAKEPIEHRAPIHLKAYMIRSGDSIYSMVTSSNLTNAGWGFGSRNFEVGVIEHDSANARRIEKFLEEMWKNEAQPDEAMWKAMEKWFSGTKWREGMEEFTLHGFDKTLHVGQEVNLEAQAPRGVSLVGRLSLSDPSVENIRLDFERESGVHKASFQIKPDHKGRVRLFVYAVKENGVVFQVLKRTATVKYRRPQIQINHSLEDGLVKINMNVETGADIVEVNPARLIFDTPPLKIITSKIDSHVKEIIIYMPMKPFTVKIPELENSTYQVRDVESAEARTDLEVFSGSVDVEVASDRRMLCEKKPTELNLKGDFEYLDQRDFQEVKVVKSVEYYDYYTSEISTYSAESEKTLSERLEVSNKFKKLPTRGKNVHVKLFAIKRKEDAQILIPLGDGVDYGLFRNPPEIKIESNRPLTNFTGARVNFCLSDRREVDQAKVHGELGSEKFYEESTDNKFVIEDLLKGASLEDLKNGLKIDARLKFMFNVADEEVSEKLNFDWFSNLKDMYWITDRTNPKATLKSDPRVRFVLKTLIDTEVETKFEFQDHSYLEFSDDFFKLNREEDLFWLPVPAEFINEFMRDNPRIRSLGGQLIIEDSFKTFVDINFLYLTIEGINPLPTAKGGYWQDVVISAPKQFERVYLEPAKKEARQIFRRYLENHSSEPEYEQFMNEKLLERVSSGKYTFDIWNVKDSTGWRRPTQEHSLSSSKDRRLQDILCCVVDVDRSCVFEIKK